MTRHAVATLTAMLTLGAITSPGLAQTAASATLAPELRTAWDSVWVAWEAGDYLRSLETMDRLLRAPGSGGLVRPAALLTGEAWRTTELTADGRNPRWSGDGRYVIVETGDRMAPRTWILTPDGSRVAELEGREAVISPDGASVMWLTSPDGGRSKVLTRPLAGGSEREIPTAGYTVRALVRGDDGTLHAVALSTDAGESRVLELNAERSPREVFAAPGGAMIGDVRPLRGGRLLASIGRTMFAVIEPAAGGSVVLEGSSPAASADGRWIAFLDRDGQDNRLRLVSTESGSPSTLRQGPERMASPALSPDGSRVAFQMMPREDWELYVSDTDGSDEIRITREIQHDLLPQFLDNDRLLAAMGEGRHRRSYLYDLRLAAQPDGSGRDVAATLLPGAPGRTRIFHNNTVRTVAPEYEWHVSPDATRLLIVAERDGDTVSPERGVYVTDLGVPVTREEVLDRIAANLAAERALQEFGAQAFAPVHDRVASAVEEVTTARIARYAQDLFQFDSKHITQPGNAKAIEYIVARLREFGYEPELEWFTPRARRGRGAQPPAAPPQEIRTANIIARLPGTTNPDLVYVASSHFDSGTRSPGADDNSSGTTALLEAARVMAQSPQAATIEFAFFTGEEAGLLGSREYVRRAVESGKRIVGALNNDMVGFANDHRLDNTIRYSNDGIRDIQHAAAFLFTDLITYDARYYKSTDAAAYYDAFGDIVGGIGSYPILASPHYHQSHDVLETINQQLVAEVAKTTVATLMLLASSPARLDGLQLERQGRALQASWDPAPERDVQGYVVTWGPAGDPSRQSARVTEPRFSWDQAPPPGTVIAVKALGRNGLGSWDARRAVVEDER